MVLKPLNEYITIFSNTGKMLIGEYSITIESAADISKLEPNLIPSAVKGVSHMILMDIHKYLDSYIINCAQSDENEFEYKILVAHCRAYIETLLDRIKTMKSVPELLIFYGASLDFIKSFYDAETLADKVRVILRMIERID